MAWIKTISNDEADGLLKQIYDTAIKRAGQVFNILRIQSLNPPVLQASMDLYTNAMHKPSPLSRAQRELLATVVSVVNKCHY